ncbi:uncharacterized protein LOC121373867 [Gigantopelta aegis]|uniref:uncharacterized protein LOC121373867 n=1 Tax=Gigantopelta aegis TaxID=1735272 RepID=UPI001B88E20A|nr:uncharacterized protein LOC121373867 [Gigantopelta aegis]
MSTAEPARVSQGPSSSERVTVIPSSFSMVSTSDITAYQSISPTYVRASSTTVYNQPSVGTVSSSTESQTPISVFSVSSLLSSVVASPTAPLPDQLFSSGNESIVISSTSVRSSLDIKSSVIPTASEMSSLTAASSYSVTGSRASVYLSPALTSDVISVSGSFTEKSLLVSDTSVSISATPPLQTSYSGSPVSTSVRFLPPLSTSDKSATATESLISASTWATAKLPTILPSSTLSYLFSSVTATSSVILSSPTTTSRKPVYNTTFDLPGPASQTESLYIVIPVCLVVLLMLVILVIMCHRWRKQVKKVYEEPPPDLWVNSHTEMAVLPAASTSTVPGIQVDNIAPFNPGDTLCCVVHPFPAQLENQISLREGDIIKILEKEENGWWRGVNQTGESGWFPGSYVETARYVPRLDDEKKKKSRVSSFLLKKKDSLLKKDQRADNTDHLDQGGYSQGGQLHIDEMMAAKQQVNKIENGTKYYAVYSYTAASKGEINLTEGEVVMGYERDRNGWMRGKRVVTNEEGWFPAVYVEEIEDTASLSSESTISGPVMYDQLTRNRNYHSNQEWIGLEHRACYSYAGEIPQDLSFEAGDKIIIYETLDNGWWLGSKGKKVGWLPGTYVQLVDPHTDDEIRSEASSDDKFRSSSEDLIRSDDETNKPKPGRKAPPPPPTRETSPVSTPDRQSPAAEPAIGAPVNDDQVNDKEIITSSRYQPIKFQRLSSDPVRPLRPAPAPPSQRSSTDLAHLNVHNTNNTERSDVKNSNLPDFKPPSPENFVTVKVSLPSRSMSMPSKKLLHGKKPEVPRRFSKPRLYIRRKSTKLTNLAVHSKPSRPVPPRPPQPVFGNRYLKRKMSREHSPVEDKMSITNVDLMTSGMSLHSDQPRVSSRTLPPDIVLSSSGDSQFNMQARCTPPLALPLPPSPEELESLTMSASADGSLDSNISQESQSNVQFKTRKVIKVPPPIVPQFKLQNLTKNSESEIINNSETQNNILTNSVEMKNVKNQDIVQEKDSGELEEDKTHIIDTTVTMPGSGSSNGQLVPDDSNTKTTNAASNELSSSVENVHKLEKQNEENIMVKKPKYKVPPVKPPPPKSPPPKVQRMVRNMEATDKSKTPTLWRAKRNYTAAAKGELSFEEGTFIKEISKALGHPGWCVGMLADGTTGLYHQSYVEESLVKEQTHV